MTSIENRTEFDAYESIASPPFYGFADEHFVIAMGVEIPGVEEIDPVVEGLLDGGDAFCFIGCGGSPDGGHAHTAEAEFGDERTVFAKGEL